MDKNAKAFDQDIEELYILLRDYRIRQNAQSNTMKKERLRLKKDIINGVFIFYLKHKGVQYD